jgi:hypothetical protein
MCPSPFSHGLPPYELRIAMNPVRTRKMDAGASIGKAVLALACAAAVLSASVGPTLAADPRHRDRDYRHRPHYGPPPPPVYAPPPVYYGAPPQYYSSPGISIVLPIRIR